MRYRLRTCFLTGLAVLALDSGEIASASAMVTYDFTGTVTSVDNSSGVFGSQIQTGAPFTLKVTLPADTPNTLGNNPDYGHYTLPQPGMAVTIGGQSYPLGPVESGAVGEVDAIPGSGEFYGTQSFLAPSNPSINSVRVDFSMVSNTGALSSDALPTSLNLANFTGSTPTMDLFVFFNNSQNSSVLATITSATVTTLGPAQPVPEPGTFLFVALAAVWLLGTCRGRSASVFDLATLGRSRHSQP